MRIASEAFYDKIKKQYEDKLPFVVYNKPNSKKINGLLQLSDVVFYVEDYTEQGFVFVPFDSAKKGMLLPTNNAEKIACDNDFYIANETSNRFSLQDEDQKKKNHIALVEKAILTIKQTKLRKVVLSRTKEIKLTTFNFIQVFKKLVQQYPSAFCYVWYHPKIGFWLGATPEGLVSINNTQYKTMALAGTQKYNGTMDVVWGEKEKTEQELVTESMQHNLKSISAEMKISKVKTIRAGSLLHLKTDIAGKANTSEVKKMVSCLHPTPAVCGFPTALAKEFILKEEGYDRTYYTGFFGELNYQKGKENTTSLFVNLRCMQYKEGRLILYIGGGITRDSNAELEWIETENKSRTMLDVLLK